MSEPRLEDSSDYDTLKGEKKKVVWAVVLVGLIMGVIYTVVATSNNEANDVIKVEETFTKVPMR